MATTDLRLLAMDDAASWFWVKLMWLIIECGADGRAVFGAGRMPHIADVARLRFRMTETEFKTQMETQSKTELIVWDAETGTLGFPRELQPDRRTIANRINGAKGGRPPKKRINERTDPAQRYLPPMAISGGKSAMTETQTETQPGSRAPIAKLAGTDISKATASLEPTKDQIDAVYKRIGPKAFEAAGYDLAKDLGNYLCARQWAGDGLKRGLSAERIERVVLDEIERIVERETKAGRRINGFGYFQKGVAKAIEAADASAPLTVADHLAEKDWEAAMKDWLRNGAKDERPRLEDFAKARAA